MVIYIENSKELTDKLLELKSNFKKVAGKKKEGCWIYKSVVLFCIGNEQELKFLKFQVLRNKFIPKNEQDLYVEKCKLYWEKLKEK